MAGQLSGGEQQRAALARSLVRAPELLLADEPFSALDALTRIRMHDLLRRLCQRHRPAVLLATHDVDEAIKLADRIVLLEAGKLVTDIAIDEKPATAKAGVTCVRNYWRKWVSMAAPRKPSPPSKRSG